MYIKYKFSVLFEMSFTFETITDEIYLKIDRQTVKLKGAAAVTPTSLPGNFPIDLPEPRSCVLTNRSVFKLTLKVKLNNFQFQQISDTKIMQKE